MLMELKVSWDVTRLRLLSSYRRSEETLCLPFHGLAVQDYVLIALPYPESGDATMLRNVGNITQLTRPYNPGYLNHLLLLYFLIHLLCSWHFSDTDVI